MKREQAASRFDKVANTLLLIGEISDQTGEGYGDVYRDAARMVKREGYKIRERM